MKKVTRGLGILMVAGSMAAPAFAAQQHHGPGFHAGMVHQQHLQGHSAQHENCGVQGPTSSEMGYSVSAAAAIGNGYLGPGRTDPLPPQVAASEKEPFPQYCCLLDSTAKPAG